ncbi:unnamed protein product [Chrysodeixis includens]|uniref:vitamin-K-epoxide reductase (warfarin-sensitive) n=1 Tax=Chrysodeixis includens TaxID=689277 RepID=A0A9P0BME1_CHRIL|nr:unnamed protein product [Chrysodeixis includens]
MKPQNLNRAIVGASLLGILISTYALNVEMSIQAKPDYKAFCDITEKISCSKVLNSEYAKGFGLLPNESPLKIPNCIYGIIFYCLSIFLSTFDQLQVVRIQLLLSLCTIPMCVYLAYLLAFVLHDFCVVCVSTYIINALLTVLTFKKMKALSTKQKPC